MILYTKRFRDRYVQLPCKRCTEKHSSYKMECTKASKFFRSGLWKRFFYLNYCEFDVREAGRSRDKNPHGGARGAQQAVVCVLSGDRERERLESSRAGVLLISIEREKRYRRGVAAGGGRSTRARQQVSEISVYRVVSYW